MSEGQKETSSPELGFPGGSVVKKKKKNLSVNARDTGGTGSVPGLRRSPRGGHGNPLQYTCVENPMDRGAWWATVYKVAESDMTEQLNRHSPELELGFLERRGIIQSERVCCCFGSAQADSKV